MRCPVCKAENREGPNCRRCKAELTLLFDVENQRSRSLRQARDRAGQGDWTGFVNAVERAHQLRADQDTERYLALGQLMLQKWSGAVRHWKKGQAQQPRNNVERTSHV